MLLLPVGLLLMYQCTLEVTGIGPASVSLNYTSSTVRVAEGDRLALECRSGVSNSSLHWWSTSNKTGFYTNGATLVIEKVRKNHRGDIFCMALDENGKNISSVTIYVDVLWSPGNIIVDGPSSALPFESVTFSCTASGNPEPSYWWSYDHDGHPIVGRGQTFTEYNFNQNVKIYCFAENTLIPTQGEHVTSAITAWKHVQIHIPATIHELPEDYSVEEGSTFDYDCKVYGIPLPAAWWTKYKSHTLINKQSRYVVQNTPKDFDGYYTCYAENNVTNSAGINTMVTVFNSTYIHVLPKGINATKVCGEGIFATLVLGWSMTVILLILGLCHLIRTHSGRTPPIWSKHHQSADEIAKSTGIKGEKYTTRRLPEPPINPDEIEYSGHSYISVRHATIDLTNPNDSNLMQTSSQDYNDGYLTPKWDRRSASAGNVYIEPKDSAKERYKELGRSDNTEPIYASV